MLVHRALLILVGSIVFGANAHGTESDEPNRPEARLSGTTIITDDIEQSINFYTQVLGFRETRIRELAGEANLSVYGVVDSEATARYTALLPAEWSKENVYLSSLNLVEIASASPSEQPRDITRFPRRSEIVLAYRVENIEEIIRRASAMDTPIIAPLSPSASGKSVTITMFDPNGVRIYLYSYVDQD